MTTGLGQPAELAEAAPERRLVTVLFADLAGYTALCARLDPEDVHDVVRPAMRALRSVAESFGATVPGIQGDGFMAVFGAPVGHEDDAERALRAAFALQSTLTTINSAPGALKIPELHIGVDSGEVAVWCGTGPDLSIAGDAVNRGARLCALAAPGEICVGPRTAELTRGRVELAGPNPTQIRGIDEPVPVYRAVGIAADAVPGRRSMSVRSAFVGRAAALRHLDVLLATARETGYTQVGVVLGDAGYGKSRLALEWSASYDDVTVISVGCTPYDDDALSPWVAAVPDLANLRETAGAGDDPVAGAVAVVRDALAAIAADRPLILILDDLHWARPDALRVIAEIHEAPWPLPMVVLGLARPDGWSGGCPTYPLAPLDDDEMTELLTTTLGGRVPDAAAAVLRRRSGGNPLFLEECLRLLVESGGIVADGQAVEVDPRSVEQIPNSMRQFIAARLDALPAGERTVLQDAAVTGDVVWDEWLRRVDPARDVDSLLGSLERRGLLRRVAESSVVGSREFAFKHALIREVAYDSLSRRVRAARHESVGAWLAEISGGSPADVPASLLAHHYAAAWDLLAADPAVAGSPRCGVAAAAVRHLSRHAAAVAAGQPRYADEILTRAVSITTAAPQCFADETMVALAVARAAARFDLQDFPAALDDLDRIEPALAGVEPAQRGRARLVRAQILSSLSLVDDAAPHFDEALGLLRDAGDAPGLAQAVRHQAYSLRLRDRSAFLSGLHRAYDAFVEIGDVVGQRDVAIDLSYELTIVGGTSYRKWYAVAESATDLHRDVRARASLRRTAAFMAQHRGENRAALELARSAYADAMAVGATRIVVDAMICELAATSALGLPDHNERVYRDAHAFAEQRGLRRFAGMAEIFSARARMLARDPHEASERLARGRARMAEIGAVLNRDADHVEVAIARDVGAAGHAEALAEPVVDALERDGAGLYAVPVRLDRARAVLVTDPRRAVDLLAEALDASRRQDTPQYGALAAVCLEQAQLLTGQPTSQRIGTAPEASVELDATVDENAALHHARRGDWAEAAAAFAVASGRWAELGATVWLARSLVWQSSALLRAGLTAPTETPQLVDRLLSDLQSPPGLVGTFGDQLTALG
ncbi:MAG TPA: adenylate/guanylate cyclase domain-containing protein [Mycobacteriales bacterium]|nr:adenylate/guanylate cyclase domain-containing protein [Mycobacteriales bacterium]